jgi:hypothetical protein
LLSVERGMTERGERGGENIFSKKIPWNLSSCHESMVRTSVPWIQRWQVPLHVSSVWYPCERVVFISRNTLRTWATVEHECLSASDRFDTLQTHYSVYLRPPGFLVRLHLNSSCFHVSTRIVNPGLNEGKEKLSLHGNGPITSDYPVTVEIHCQTSVNTFRHEGLFHSPSSLPRGNPGKCFEKRYSTE